MKKSWWIGLAAAALAAFTAFQDVPNEARRTDIHTVTGTVRSYAPQGHVVIVGSDGSEHSFPLDAGARVADGVSEGQRVAVAWLTESTGRPRVTSIAPVETPASADASARGETSSAPPSKAYASANEGTAMSSTPSGPMSETPRPVPTEGSAYATPGARAPSSRSPTSTTSASGSIRASSTSARWNP